MGNYFNSAQLLLDNIGDFLLGCNYVCATAQYDFTNISNKMETLNGTATVSFKSYIFDINSIKEYIIDSFSRFSKGIRKTTSIFRREKKENNNSLEDIVRQNNQDAKYTSRSVDRVNITSTNSTYLTKINYIIDKKNSVSEIAKLLSGRHGSSWRWTDRLKLFSSHLTNSKLLREDKNDLEKLKTALKSNYYLRKNHSQIYENINAQINNVAEGL